MMEVKFNVWVVLLIFLVGVNFVYSYSVGGSGFGDPSIMGHSADEIEVNDDFCNKITGNNCFFQLP